MVDSMPDGKPLSADAGAGRALAVESSSAYNEYADEFELNDIGLALRVQSHDIR
jgi:hypothetical protein